MTDSTDDVEGLYDGEDESDPCPDCLTLAKMLDDFIVSVIATNEVVEVAHGFNRRLQDFIKEREG